MFIDDDEINNFILKELFENQYNLKVTFFTEAAKALEHIREVAKDQKEALPNIIFLDIKMPEMDGFDFMDAFQEESYSRDFSVPIFMLTSSVNQRDISRAGTYPHIKELVTKPLTVDKLEGLVQKYF